MEVSFVPVVINLNWKGVIQMIKLILSLIKYAVKLIMIANKKMETLAAEVDKK